METYSSCNTTRTSAAECVQEFHAEKLSAENTEQLVRISSNSLVLTVGLTAKNSLEIAVDTTEFFFGGDQQDGTNTMLKVSQSVPEMRREP